MQISQVTMDHLAEMLAEGEHLANLDYGPQRVHVLHWGEVDVLAIVCPVTGDAIVVSPCSQDDDSGGSIHDHARQIFGA